jgi:hypothetical protein
MVIDSGASSELSAFSDQHTVSFASPGAELPG